MNAELSRQLTVGNLPFVVHRSSFKKRCIRVSIPYLRLDRAMCRAATLMHRRSDQGESRTPTPCGTRLSTSRVYPFHHLVKKVADSRVALDRQAYETRPGTG